MSELVIEAPIKVELKVIVVNDDGGQGEVTFELPAMRFPTRESIIDAIKEVSESTVVLNNDLHVASQRETFDYICRERMGGDIQFAMPVNAGKWYDEK